MHGGPRRIFVTDERDARKQREDDDDVDRAGLAEAIRTRMKEIQMAGPDDLATSAGISIAYARAMRNGTGKHRFSSDALSKAAVALHWDQDPFFLYRKFYRQRDRPYISQSMVEIVRQVVREEIAPVKKDVSLVRADMNAVSSRLAIVLGEGDHPPAG
jgi:hypothetical protein